MAVPRPDRSSVGESARSADRGESEQPADDPVALTARDAAAAESGEAERAGRLALRWDVAWVLLIFVVALGLRAVYLYQVRSCPFYGHEIMDAKFHRQWGEAFAAGETFMEGPYFRGPLYPWFLGMIYWLFGRSDLLPRVIQIVVGSAGCGLVYLIGRQAFSRRVGILAGFAAATYSIFLYFEAELLVSWLPVFLDLLLVWLLLLARERRSPWPWLASGGVLGLSAIARPTILLFTPAVLVWLVVLHRPSWRRGCGYASCFVLGCAAFIAPVTVRNYKVGDDLVLVSSSAGVNFFIGNNPGSDGMTAVVPGTPAEWWAGYDAQIQRAQDAAGRPLKASEVSRYYWREAFRFMGEQPGAAAALMLRKLGLFWSRWEVSNNQDIRFVTDNFAPVVKVLPLTFWAVGSLGLVGLLISFGRLRRLFPLWGFVLVYMIGVAAFFVTARYRLPVVPVLMVLGSHTVFWCIDALRAARWRWAALAGVALVPAAALVSRVPSGVEVGMALSYGSAGIVFAEQGRVAEAEEYLRESLRRHAAQPKTSYTLGLVLMQQGKDAEAERWLRETLTLTSDVEFPDARKHLGFVLSRQGKLDEAIAQFNQVLASSPNDAELLANLGGVLIQNGQIAEGLEAMRRGIRIEPATARSLEMVARRLFYDRRFADARRILEGGVAEASSDVRLLTQLTKLLAVCPDPSLRDSALAVQHGERACQLSGWTNPDALHALAAAQFAAGHLAEAIDTARQAVAQARQQGNPQAAARMEAWLRHYESRLASPDVDPSAAPDRP